MFRLPSGGCEKRYCTYLWRTNKTKIHRWTSDQAYVWGGRGVTLLTCAVTLFADFPHVVERLLTIAHAQCITKLLKFKAHFCLAALFQQLVGIIAHYMQTCNVLIHTFIGYHVPNCNTPNIIQTNRWSLILVEINPSPLLPNFVKYKYANPNRISLVYIINCAHSGLRDILRLRLAYHQVTYSDAFALIPPSSAVPWLAKHLSLYYRALFTARLQYRILREPRKSKSHLQTSLQSGTAFLHCWQYPLHNRPTFLGILKNEVQRKGIGWKK